MTPYTQVVYGTVPITVSCFGRCPLHSVWWCLNACIRLWRSLRLSIRFWTSWRGLILISGTAHRISISLSACYLILMPSRYASMVELIKPDVGYATGFVTHYKPHLFHVSDSLYCQRCLQRSQARTWQCKRSLKIGRLRPNVLLYNEPRPEDKEILETAKHDWEYARSWCWLRARS